MSNVKQVAFHRSTVVLIVAVCIASASPLAQASLSVPLAPQQVMALPPPGNDTYDPPLPPGTATQDATWVSYLPPEGTVVSLHGGSGELPLLIGGNVSLLAANASVQRDEWLRVDVLLGNVSLGGGAVPSINWTSPGGVALGGLQLPHVRLESLGDAPCAAGVLGGCPHLRAGAACLVKYTYGHHMLCCGALLQQQCLWQHGRQLHLPHVGGPPGPWAGAADAACGAAGVCERATQRGTAGARGGGAVRPYCSWWASCLCYRSRWVAVVLGAWR